jgi:hypothetical protein
LSGRASGTPAARLRQVLEQLSAAKQLLLKETEALRVVDTRVRSWDLSEPFLARRSHALRAEATARFGEALDRLHDLLLRVSDGGLGGKSPARSSQSRKLMVEIRNELRYLQRAFDGGSVLLASTLETFGAS